MCNSSEKTFMQFIFLLAVIIFMGFPLVASAENNIVNDDNKKITVEYVNVSVNDIAPFMSGNLLTEAILSDDYKNNCLQIVINNYYGQFHSVPYDPNDSLLKNNPEFELTGLIINGQDYSYYIPKNGYSEYDQDYYGEDSIGLTVDGVTSPSFDPNDEWCLYDPVYLSNSNGNLILGFNEIEALNDIYIKLIFAGDSPNYVPDNTVGIEFEGIEYATIDEVVTRFEGNVNEGSTYRFISNPPSGLRLKSVIDEKGKEFFSNDGKTAVCIVSENDTKYTAVFRKQKCPILSITSSNYGSYEGADVWLNFAVDFDLCDYEDEYEATFFLTDKEDGLLSEDAIVSGEATTLKELKSPGFNGRNIRNNRLDYGLLIDNTIKSGHYYIGCSIDVGSAQYYNYIPFIVFDTPNEYIKAGIDTIINSYYTNWYVKNDTFIGLDSVTDDYGMQWETWIFSALDKYHIKDDSVIDMNIKGPFLHPGEGKNYLEQKAERYAATTDDFITNLGTKNLFKDITAYAAAGYDPRNVGGKNLVKALCKWLKNENGTPAIDKNGFLTLPDYILKTGESPDGLIIGYELLGLEIAGATDKEGYTDEIRDAGIKYILSLYGEDKIEDASSMGLDGYAMSIMPLLFAKERSIYKEACERALQRFSEYISNYRIASNGAIAYNWDDSDWRNPNADTEAVVINTLVLSGLKDKEISRGPFQKEYGSLLTSLCGQIIEGGVLYGDTVNRMATYQTLGALVDLYNGKSCFETARDKYKEKYPQYFVPGGDDDPVVVTKKKQPMTIKPVLKKVSFKKLKKKAQVVKGALIVKNNKGRVSYKKIGGSKKLTINKKTGRITVKKKTRKGTYKIRLKVTAAGNSLFKAGSKIVTVKIRVA